MYINFEEIKVELIGTRIPKPISGTLSGHAAGEPFDKHVYDVLKQKMPSNTYRQFEYLNKLFASHPEAVTYGQRHKLTASKSARFLIQRGNAPTQKWSTENIFEEKQNDTADILVTDGNVFNIIDIKTRRMDRSAQPPNIISAFKLANLMASLIDNNEFDTVNIIYIEIQWELQGDFLLCTDVHYKTLSKIDPNDLYINWAAAMQVQFHVSEIKENYQGNKVDWAYDFLETFRSQATKRTEVMINKFVNPYLKYKK